MLTHKSINKASGSFVSDGSYHKKLITRDTNIGIFYKYYMNEKG